MDAKHKKELIEAGIIVAIAIGLFWFLKRGSVNYLPDTIDTTPIAPDPSPLQSDNYTYNYPANSAADPAAANPFNFSVGDNNLSLGGIGASGGCGCCSAPPVSGDAVDSTQQLARIPQITESNPYSGLGFNLDGLPGGYVRLDNGNEMSLDDYHRLVALAEQSGYYA